jgi:hypothetical protein
MRRILLMLASVVLFTALLVSGTAAADGLWFDGPVTNWNQPGMTVPTAPPRDPAVNPRCFEGDNAPVSRPEQIVVDAGWTLVGSRAAGLPLEMVLATSSFDGMCRPMQYQVFVFADRQFAGTMSPVLMDSRSDGALTGRELHPNDVIVGIYVRYTPADPLCCPSARSRALFQIDRSGGSPLLVLKELSTEANPETPSPSPSPTGPVVPTPSVPQPTAPPSSAPLQAPVQLPRRP